jgi:hypothetical protein
MSRISPQDEFIHQDYPRGGEVAWKENWYFNFIDREHNAWGINHISLSRHNQSANFRAFHVVDGEILVHSKAIPIGEDYTELTDGNLRVEFVEPHKKFRLTFHGPRHSLELNYLARFELFNYHGWEGDAVNDERSRFVALNHYEQALTATGTLVKDGVSRPIACLGHRDHSWGYRDESKMAGWNWVAVQFPGATINLSQVCVAGKEPMHGGFVSEATGNTRMRTVKIVSTERGEDGIPVASTYEAVDERGRTWTLGSRRFSGLVLPLSEAGERVIVYENFADFTLVQTGEQGVGIDEYMDSP